MHDKTPSYLFLDLETSGLNPDEDFILEAGIVITDQDFNKICSYSDAVAHTPAKCSEITDWSRENLSELVKYIESGGGISLPSIEMVILNYIDEFWPKDDPVHLAGFSIHFDRSFIRKHMPTLHRRLHYRMLDVTSLCLVAQTLGREHVKHDIAHRVIPDIEQCISTLKECIEFFRSS